VIVVTFEFYHNLHNLIVSDLDLQFQTLCTAGEFQSLEPEWDGLLQQSAAKTFFLSFAYLKTWLENAGPEVKLHIVTARNAAGQLCGIAPLCVVSGRKGLRRRLRHLTFMGGQHDSLAEYGDYIILPALEMEIAPAFTRMALGSRALKWDLLTFQLARSNSVSMGVVQDELSRFGNPEITVQPAWICGMAETWEGFLASRSSRIRQGIRYRDRRMGREHKIEFHHAGRDLSHAEALDVLIRLNRMRWGQEGTAFHTDRFISFHRALVAQMGPSGHASIMLLQADGEYIAARYDFPWGGRVINFQTGWHPDWAVYSPSLVLLSHAVQHFREQGFTEYDFLAGDAKYKQDWSTRTEPLVNIEMPNPRSLRAKAFFGLRKLKDMADSMRPSPAPSNAGESPEPEPAAA
jgi:CelD/BcsL family acetyltransferase involved in cellulose biosynthesis